MTADDAPMTPDGRRRWLERRSEGAAGPARSRFLDYQVQAFVERGSVLAARGPDDGWSAAVAHFAAPDGFGEAVWVERQDATVLSWAIDGAPVICELPHVQGRKSRPTAGQFTLQPAGLPNHYRCEGSVEFAQFYLPHGVLDTVAEALALPRPGRDLLRDDLVFEDDDALFQGLNRYLRRAVSRDEPPTRLEMETLAVLIVERLVGRHLAGGGPAARPSLPGADWRVRRTIERIEDGLDNEARLHELAAAVGLGPSQLARVFRAATGTSIHRWVLLRRIERAKRRLVEAGASITEIALDLGFASSQHFATTFRRQTGVSPGVYRRSRLG